MRTIHSLARPLAWAVILSLLLPVSVSAAWH